MKEGAVLIKSIVLAKDKKVEKAVELLKKFTTEKVDDQLKLKLTAVQLLLSQVSWHFFNGRDEKLNYFFSNKNLTSLLVVSKKCKKNTEPLNQSTDLELIIIFVLEW